MIPRSKSILTRLRANGPLHSLTNITWWVNSLTDSTFRTLGRCSYIKCIFSPEHMSLRTLILPLSSTKFRSAITIYYPTYPTSIESTPTSRIVPLVKLRFMGSYYLERLSLNFKDVKVLSIYYLSNLSELN